MLYYITTISLIIIVVILWWTWHTKPSPGEPPMLPGCWPVVGHLPRIVGNSLNLWNALKYCSEEIETIGRVCRIFIGPIKLYIISDPDECTKFSNICLEKDSTTYKFTNNLLGDGLLFGKVSIWKKHRKLLNPTFNQQILDNFMGIFNSQGKRMAKSLQTEVGKRPFDHSHCIRNSFMEAICLTMIDESVTEEQAAQYVHNLDKYLEINISRFLNLFYHSDFIFNFTSKKKQVDEIINFFFQISDSVLQKKRYLRKHNIQKNNNESNPKKKVFMDLLIDLEGKVLTDQEIRSEINTMIMAGHETMATITVFALLYIGTYPEVQERIYKELNEVLGDKEDVEKQDLPKLVYLDAVLKETMRYCGMIPSLARYVDQEVKLSNCTLKPGYNCIMLTQNIYRDPQWGPDVNEFRPERWLNPDTLPKNPNLYVMFGVGKRSCIGKNYAMMSMKTVSSHILRRYKFHADHTKMVFKLDVILKPVSGHFIAIEERIKNIN